jgi:hypothetical protein
MVEVLLIEKQSWNDRGADDEHCPPGAIKHVFGIYFTQRRGY